MKHGFVKDSDMEEWLANVWDRTFQWDDGQLEKKTDNPLVPSDIEDLILNHNPLFVGKSTYPSDEPRYIVIVQRGNRFFTIVWAARGKQIRALAWRGAKEHEKEFYSSNAR